MSCDRSPSEKMAASALKESLSTKNLPTADSNGFRMGIVVPAERGVLAALHNGDGRTLWAVRVGEQCTPAALKHVSMPRSAFSGGRHSSEDAKESVVVALLRCGADRWSSVAVHAHSGEVIARNDASGRLVKVVAPAEGEGIGAVVADGRGALAISVVPASVREGFLEAFAERMYVWVPEDRGISGG